MSLETNKLVGKAGRFGAPVGAALALVLADTFFFHHSGVHAAMISSPPPMDDNSVSSLVSLDNAVEAVSARGTPAGGDVDLRSEKHTPEIQSRQYLVCPLLPLKKKKETVLNGLRT